MKSGGKLSQRLSILRISLCLLVFSFAASSLFGDRYALLVGIDDYKHARKLKGALNDIKEIKRLLVNDLAFDESRILVLTDQQASKEGILSAISGLSRQMQAGDALLWYYSGHGFMMMDEDGDESLLDADDQLDEVLVPQDAVPWPRERATDPNPTMLSDDLIARSLSAMRGKRVVVIFDSCHSGTGTRALGEADSRALYEGYVPSARPKTKGLGRGDEQIEGPVLFVSAALPWQTASDLGEYGGHRHGALTASLLRSVDALGPGWARRTTWSELFNLAKKDLADHGFSQTPSMRGLYGLEHQPVSQFFNPSAAQEISTISPPANAFEVELESTKYLFQEGDDLEVALKSSRDGYLYLFDIDPEQKITLLFPNRFANDNRVWAGKMRAVPAEHDKFRIKAGRPFGRSQILAIVTRRPWSEAARLKLPADLRPFSDNQVSGFRDLTRGLSNETPDPDPESVWSCQKIVLELVPHGLAAPQTSTVQVSSIDQEDLLPIASRDKKDDGPVVASGAKAKKQQSKNEKREQTSSVKLSLPDRKTPADRQEDTDELAVVAAPTDEPQAAVGDSGLDRDRLDDTNLTREEQSNLARSRPRLFAKLEGLAKRYSPVFWQDIKGAWGARFRPWKDFIVRFDFDQTEEGPNWPDPPHFQDELKRRRNQLLDELSARESEVELEPVEELPGMFRLRHRVTGGSLILDLRPYVYWSVLATRSHYFFHYVAFHAEDWKGLFGHAGDLEGCTVVVDRKTERLVATFILAHDDVDVVRDLYEEPAPNVSVLIDPSVESRDLLEEEDDDRPIDGLLEMDVGRDGDSRPVEHQNIYVESKGHGQHGPKKIMPSRYIIYANFLDDSAFQAPSFERSMYPKTDRFEEVKAKYKYELLYIGSETDIPEKLWGEYWTLDRFPGGVNPPWNWRDNLFFKTGWWRDPRRIKKIGDPEYVINPYLEMKQENR